MPYSSMPLPGMGTYRLKGNDARTAIQTALELGYRHLDTAVMYDNESDVGAAIAASDINRDDLFITTKVWHSELSDAAMSASVDGSLQRLATDYIDLLLIHWPAPNDSVPMSDYLMSLKAQRDAGKTRHIGVSNFTIAQLQQAIDILGEGEILTNQIEVHPYMQNRAVVDFCQQHGITVVGYMPLAVGRVMHDATLNEIASEHQVTAAQVALAWLYQRNIVPIPASRQRTHLQANLDAMAVELSDEQMARIDQLDRGERLANPSFAPDWD